MHIPLGPVNIFRILPSRIIVLAPSTGLSSLWIRITYSGRCPTSIKATRGALSAENAVSRGGRAALTSGHQGAPVFGSREAWKETKNGEWVGRSKASADLGSS